MHQWFHLSFQNAGALQSNTNTSVSSTLPHHCKWDLSNSRAFFTCKYYSTVNTILTVKGRLSRTKLILTPSQPCSLLNFIWCSNWWVLLSNPPAMQSKGKKTADVFVKMEAWSEVGGRTIAKALAGGQLLQLTHSNCVWQHITQHKHVFHKPTTILTVFS